jgi:hypothetical protein
MLKAHQKFYCNPPDTHYLQFQLAIFVPIQYQLGGGMSCIACTTSLIADFTSTETLPASASVTGVAGAVLPNSTAVVSEPVPTETFGALEASGTTTLAVVPVKF